MVKYGSCMIQCTKCGKGCSVKTQIQRNGGWDKGIVSQECAHGKMIIDMLTRNTYTPFGDPDEIRFDVRFIFAPESGYEGTLKKSFSRTSTESGDEHESENCALFEAHFSGNGLSDYFQNVTTDIFQTFQKGQYCETRIW